MRRLSALDMQVTPFPYDRLPRLRRAELSLLRQLRATLGQQRVAALRRWASQLGLPAHQPVALDAQLLPQLESERRAAVLGAAVARIELLGPRAGRAWLLLDGKLAARLTALLLHGEPLPPSRPLSVGERGLITYAVAALLHELALVDWSVTLGCETVPGGPWLEATLKLGDGAGRAWLILDELGLPESKSPQAPALGRLGELDLRLPLELGRLQVGADDLQNLGTGDVLIFPGCPKPAADELPARLRVGGGGFAAKVCAADGATRCGSRVLIEERFRMGEPTMADNDKRALAEQLELEVAVELGRVRVTGAQLMDLGPGDVIALEQPLAAPVRLRVGGRVIAQGELVEVEGEAGVRLTELFE